MKSIGFAITRTASKKVFIIHLLILLPMLFFNVAFANANKNKALAMLMQMNQAVNRLSYQINFILCDKGQEPNTFEYVYIGSAEKKERMARLSYLEGPQKEIILHNGMISYLQTNGASFSILSTHITEAFPDVVFADLSHLQHVYDIIFLGKMRVLNRSTNMIKIVSKAKDRNTYIIWIDAETALPLRIDLRDLNNQLLQQMKVVSIDLKIDSQKEKEQINQKKFPILLAIEEQLNPQDKWKLGWIPDGFAEIPTYNVSFFHSDTPTKFFSDGVFSFIVNIADDKQNKKSKKNRVFTLGGRTILLTHIQNKKVYIIGDLPLSTIERIASNIIQKPT